MGLIRKAASLSTLGGVKYTSRREAQTKAASTQAKAAREEAKLLKAQRKAVEVELVQDRPATAQLTIRQMVQERLAKHSSNSS